MSYITFYIDPSDTKHNTTVFVALTSEYRSDAPNGYRVYYSDKYLNAKVFLNVLIDMFSMNISDNDSFCYGEFVIFSEISRSNLLQRFLELVDDIELRHIGNIHDNPSEGTNICGFVSPDGKKCCHVVSRASTWTCCL